MSSQLHSNRTIPPKAGKNRIVELPADLCTMRNPDRNETIALVSGKRVGACLFCVYISNQTIQPKAGKNRIVELPADFCAMRNPARNKTIALVLGKRVSACLFFVYLSNRTIPPKKTAGKNRIVNFLFLLKRG